MRYAAQSRSQQRAFERYIEKAPTCLLIAHRATIFASQVTHITLGIARRFPTASIPYEPASSSAGTRRRGGDLLVSPAGATGIWRDHVLFQKRPFAPALHHLGVDIAEQIAFTVMHPLGFRGGGGGERLGKTDSPALASE